MEDLTGDSIPTTEQLLAALDGLTGLPPEEKENIRRQLLASQEAAGSAFTNQMIVLLSLLLLIGVIFVFFGYKLYKSLKDKEKRKDEKKRLKQHKKKK